MNIKKEFVSRFKHSPEIIINSPGRINIIGEHTDYNNGFVLPAAVDKKITFALAKSLHPGVVRIFAYDLKQYSSFHLSEANQNHKGWVKFIMAITDSFLKPHQGFDCVFGGDLPIGSGMSSSSALTCGLAVGLSKLYNYNIDSIDLIKNVQNAEALYTGVRGGIMDQFVIVMGRQNCAMKLDCRTLEFEQYPLNLKNYTFLLCNTGVQHELANSEYNTRREECEAGVANLQSKGHPIKSLRDVDLNTLNQHRTDFDPIIFNRCAYVIKENDRVTKACNALQNKNLTQLGNYMYASHFGLQNEYEVSCDELDFLVNQTQTMSSILGARMMGGGFGGCTINLVESNQLDKVIDHLSEQYFKYCKRELVTYEVNTADGLLGDN